jgi:hypothetical protein
MAQCRPVAVEPLHMGANGRDGSLPAVGHEHFPRQRIAGFTSLPQCVAIELYLSCIVVHVARELTSQPSAGGQRDGCRGRG